MMMRFSIVPLMLLAGLATAQSPQERPTPEQSYFEWSKLPFEKDVYRERRERMLARLRESGGGVFLIPARHGVSDGFTFRQLDDFIYFTGLELPNAVVVLDADASTVTVFSPEHDARFANPSRANDFPGRTLIADPAMDDTSGIADLRPIRALSPEIAKWVADGRAVRVNFGRRGAIPEIESDFVRSYSAAEALVLHLRNTFSGLSLDNAYDAVARVRAVHDASAIAAMRRVCDLTMASIRHAAGFVTDGVDERTLEAELEAAFKRGGSQRLAFASIIKSGPNSLWPWRILASSYDRRNRVIRDGELVVFDVGTELDYYVSDVGRTFPVSGKFTARQRRAIEMTTAVSDAVIAAIEPGVTLAELKAIAVSKIPPDERRYMQAGGFYGHHIGLSTGEPVLTDLPLEAGMIFTVEPWYYNHDEELSVFVEDVILVTEDGHENLTAMLPRSPDGLEAMAGAAP